MMSDPQLLNQYLDQGSEAAFAALAERYLPLVYHAALRPLGGASHLAEDVAQSVFVLLARKASSLRRHPSLVGWLFTTTHYLAANAHRTEQRRLRREQEAYSLMEANPERDLEREGRALRLFVDEVLMKMEPADRETVLLRYFQGLPYAQIGAQLGVSEDAAQKRVERALGRLRQGLESRKLRSSGAALTAVLASNVALAVPTGLSAKIAGASFTSANSGFSLLNFLHSMSITKNSAAATALLGLASVVGIASLGTGVYELHNYFQYRTAAATATRRLDADQARLRDLTQQEQAVARSGVAPAVQPLAGAGHEAEAAVRDQGNAEWRRFVAAHPEASQMWLNAAHAELDRSFGPFFKATRLAPDQVAQFEDETVKNTALAPNTLQPLTVDQVRTLFGDAIAQSYQDYIRIQSAEGFALNLAANAGNSGTPLTFDQTQQLASVFATNSAGYQSGGKARLTDIDWANAATQVQAAVTPGEWPAVQRGMLHMQLDLAAAAAARAATVSEK